MMLKHVHVCMQMTVKCLLIFKELHRMALYALNVFHLNKIHYLLRKSTVAMFIVPFTYYLLRTCAPRVC